MIRKTLIGALMLVALLASPAAAQYGSFTVNPGTTEPGGTASFSGNGCQPGETVTVTFLGSTVATVVANAEGEYTGSFPVPASTAPGTYTVTATCGSVVHSDTLTVVSSGGAITGTGTGTGTLPRTGSNVNVMGMVGAGLLTAGGLLLLATRKRRATI